MCHLVSAFVGANRLVLGQLAVDGAGGGGGGGGGGDEEEERRRGNEITAIPKLLELPDLRGARRSASTRSAASARSRRRCGNAAATTSRASRRTSRNCTARSRRCRTRRSSRGSRPRTWPATTSRRSTAITAGSRRGASGARTADHLKLDEPWPGVEGANDLNDAAQALRDAVNNKAPEEDVKVLMEHVQKSFAEVEKRLWAEVKE
jgi:hypothetical protein